MACLDDSVCAADKPVCDATAGACRGCAADDECASGVCLDADGTCASEDEVAYVQADQRDQGDCTRSEPCGTVPYALQKIVGKRRVISVTAGQAFLTGTLAIDRSVTIDANGTLFSRAGVVLSVPSATTVTLSNVMLAGTGASGVAATVSSTGGLRIYNSTVTGPLTTNGGGISMIKSTLSNPVLGNVESLICSGGTITATQSRFERAAISASNCQVTVTRSRLEMVGNQSVAVSGGFLRLENCVITNSDNGADNVHVDGVAPGSTVRFNTIVSTAGAPSDGAALYTDGTAIVTSNVFAYDSMHPLGSGSVATRYSLFDATALASQTAGANNRTGDATKFFVDRARKDFHLGANSPARGAAEPGLGVLEDIDGQPRPAAPDMGAYQAR